MATTIAISQFCGNQEQTYRAFPVTEEGLKAASDYLGCAMARAHRRGLSPWQFDYPWDGQLRAAERMILAGNVAALKKHLKLCEPQI